MYLRLHRKDSGNRVDQCTLPLIHSSSYKYTNSRDKQGTLQLLISTGAALLHIIVDAVGEHFTQIHAYPEEAHSIEWVYGTAMFLVAGQTRIDVVSLKGENSQNTVLGYSKHHKEMGDTDGWIE